MYLTSEGAFTTSRKVICKLDPKTLDVFAEGAIRLDDLLTFVRVLGTAAEGWVLNEGEHNRCNHKVTGGHLVTADEGRASLNKLRVEVLSKLGDALSVGSFGLVVVVLGGVGFVEDHKVVGPVNGRIAVPSSVIVFGVVPVLFAEEAQDGFGLVVVVAILDPDWHLTVRELAGSLALLHFVKGDLLILVLDFAVREQHFDAGASSEKWEVDKFGCCHKDIKCYLN